MSNDNAYPANWLIGQEYDPNAHMMKMERKDKRSGRLVVSDYLNVQQRMIWFIRDQRALIVGGLGKVPYLIHTELTSESTDWAEFKTTVRDVLGNECTMYGSESKADFFDYREKASTKSLGRALAMLGYGTQYAPEIDEGERVVDSPVERQNAPQTRQDDRSAAQATTPVPNTTPPATKTPQNAQNDGDAQNVPPIPLDKVMAWLNKRGYLTVEAKHKVIAAAGLKLKSGSLLYTADEQRQLYGYIRAHEPEKVPA